MHVTEQELAAHIEIQQVLYRYCRGIDRGDRDLIASLYHEEALDNHGGFHGSGAEFAAWIVDLMDQNSIVGQHHITNVLIQLDGECAHVESYFFAYHPDVTQDGKAEGLALVGGRYLDRFERRQGCWKIGDRRVVLDFTRPAEPCEAWSGASSFTRGARREADLSHGFIRHQKR